MSNARDDLPEPESPVSTTNSGIDSVILEGGGTLNFSALQAGIVNRVQTYIAPKIFGGADSKTAVEGQGIANVDEAYRLRNKTVRLLGDDILIEGEL